GVPIMIGTRGERMLGLTARYAEMWNAWLPSQGNDPSEMPPLLARVDAACQEAGRDPRTLERTVAVQVCLSGEARYGAAPSGDTWVEGPYSAQQWREQSRGGSPIDATRVTEESPEETSA